MIIPFNVIDFYRGVCINIIKIDDIHNFVDNVELKISYTELIFETAFENTFATSQIDQIIENNYNKFNLFRVLSNIGVNVLPNYLTKEEFNAIASTIDSDEIP
jgi:hypothetical protein